MKPPRAALYARVSTPNRGQDVGLQVDALRRLAGTRGWSLVKVCVDEGISGARESRPARGRMMANARAGKPDVVWEFRRFRSFDRLSSCRLRRLPQGCRPLRLR